MLRGFDFARSLLGKSIRPQFTPPHNVTKGQSLCHIHKMDAPTARPFTLFNSAHLTRTAESSRNPGAPAGRVLAQNEFRTNRRRQWRLRRESGLSEIERQGPAPGPSVPVYESEVLSNSLKSFGLPLPRLAFMHWPTKKPMTFWLPSRYCCACSAQFASTSSTIGCSAPASLT